MIWWFNLVRKLAHFAFAAERAHAARLDDSLRLAQAEMDRMRSRFDAQLTEGRAVNTRLTLEKALLEKDCGYLRLENERLKAELLDSVMQSKILIDKIGTPAPAKDMKAIKRLMAQEDPFAEHGEQPDVFVDGKRPDELGEDIAAAFTKQG